ncbi:hypothetical protein [uncultured Duncaniella sp.]|uniref:hypothetical protein n=1 Tax=uncultured Duncaniella sp. TaxID=2768039 RepID=UPI00262871D4|nr:hypothetical protein [uncultured Duncaniella sp.]
MEPMQLAVACLIILLGIVLVVVTYNKRGQSMDLNQFISEYGDYLLKCLKQAVDILEVRMTNFNSMAEYYAAIIEQALDIIGDTIESIGLKANILNTFDTEALSITLGKLLESHKLDIFSTVDPYNIAANTALFDDEVIQALAPAVNNGELSDEDELPIVDADDPTDEEYDAMVGNGPPEEEDDEDRNPTEAGEPIPN